MNRCWLPLTAGPARLGHNTTGREEGTTRRLNQDSPLPSYFWHESYNRPFCCCFFLNLSANIFFSSQKAQESLLVRLLVPFHFGVLLHLSEAASKLNPRAFNLRKSCCTLFFLTSHKKASKAGGGKIKQAVDPLVES